MALFHLGIAVHNILVKQLPCKVKVIFKQRGRASKNFAEGGVEAFGPVCIIPGCQPPGEPVGKRST
jgi:hypothetical protein